MENMTNVLESLGEPNALSPLSTAVHDEEDFASLGHPHPGGSIVESHIGSDGEETLVPAEGVDDSEDHNDIVPTSITGDDDDHHIGLSVAGTPSETLHHEVEGLESVVNEADNVHNESLEEGDEQASLGQHGLLTTQTHLGEGGIQESVLLTTDAEGNLAMPVSTDQVIRFLLQTSDGNVVAADAQVEAIKLSMPGLMSSREITQTVQAFTLPDGTTFFQTQKEDNSNEGQHVIKEVEGQTIKLEDGTTALLHPRETLPEGTLQAIQLEDGTTALITPNPDGSFDTTSVNLDHLQTQTLLGVTDKPEKDLVIGDKAYKCMYEDCGRLYTTLHHLRVHERSHTGDRPFICEYQGCGKAFATGYGLKSHNRVHTGEKPYPCPEAGCEKAFKTSGDLQKHVRTHTGERPFKCPFEGCTRSFTTSNIRKVHIRTHTGERPYICDVEGCGRAFASATNYKNHIRIHTGEKPYVCSVQGCGKAFTEYSSLYKHHVVHTHTKPYTCCYCGKTYRQTSTLAMHKRSAHGEDLPAEGVTENETLEQPVKKKVKLEVRTTEVENQIPVSQGNSNSQMVLLAPQVTTAENVSPGQDSQMANLVTLQAPSGTFSLADLQQSGLQQISSLALGEGHQVLVVADPAQLELLQVCKIRGSKARDPEEQTLWLMDHKESCHANYSGSSGGMEAEAAKVLWGRSMDYGLRYTTLIGDGDSKTFNAIQDLNPYNGVEVKKAECVNHVAKRLGTALRNLVNTEKKRGVTLGGRGSGTLTQEKIGKLQSYYTKAVRSCNSSVEQMSNGVWAAFFHSTSSDDDPKHHFCPEGPDSWCFHNRAIARQEAPPSHAGRLMTALNCTVAPYVEQVYKRLTDSSLLEKCLLGVTQNQNESFHAQIWLRCPKHIFVTRPRIEVATSLAICEWNQGSVGTQKFMRNLGLCISSRSVLSGQKRDRVRVRKAEQAQMEPAKRRRTVRKCAAQRENQRRAQMERHPYESGAGGY